MADYRTTTGRSRLSRLRYDLDRTDRLSLAGMAGAVALLHLIGFGLLIVLLDDRRPGVLAGGGIVAYLIGLRRAFDPGQVAAIGDSAAEVARTGRRTLTVGFWFALGYATTVTALTLLLTMAAQSFAWWSGLEGFVPQLIADGAEAGIFLGLLGIVSLLVLFGVLRRRRDGVVLPPQPRFLGRLTGWVRSPWQLSVTGLLFGLKPGIAGEAGLLVLATGVAVFALPAYPVIVVPLLFAAGMSLAGLTQGLLVIDPYGTADEEQTRAGAYQLGAAALAGAAALVVGVFPLVGTLGDLPGIDLPDQLDITGGPLVEIAQVLTSGPVLIPLLVVLLALIAAYAVLRRRDQGGGRSSAAAGSGARSRPATASGGQFRSASAGGEAAAAVGGPVQPTAAESRRDRAAARREARAARTAEKREARWAKAAEKAEARTAKVAAKQEARRASWAAQTAQPQPAGPEPRRPVAASNPRRPVSAEPRWPAARPVATGTQAFASVPEPRRPASAPPAQPVAPVPQPAPIRRRAVAQARVNGETPVAQQPAQRRVVASAPVSGGGAVAQQPSSRAAAGLSSAPADGIPTNRQPAPRSVAGQTPVSDGRVPRQLIDETMIDQGPRVDREPRVDQGPGVDHEPRVDHEPEFGPDPRVGQPVVEEPTMAGDSVGALVLPMQAEVAVVTGAGAGLGRAIASGLASAGYGIVAVDIDPDSAAACATQVRAFGVPARAVRADIRDPQYLERIVAVADELGGAGILVNSVGSGTLDLTASMLLSQLVLEPMQAGGGGAIVNVVSSPDAEDRLIRFTATLAGLADGYGVRAMCVTADPRRTHPADLVTAVLDLIERGRPGAVVQMETVGLRPNPA